jgi:hypothetical protein
MKQIKFYSVFSVLAAVIAMSSASVGSPTILPQPAAHNPMDGVIFSSSPPPAKIAITYQLIDVPRPAWNALLNKYQNADSLIAQKVVKAFRPYRMDSETIYPDQTLDINLDVERTDTATMQPSTLGLNDYLKTGDDVSIIPGKPIGNIILVNVVHKATYSTPSPTVLTAPIMATSSDNTIIRMQSAVPTILVTPSESTPGNTLTTVRVTLLTATVLNN